MSIGFLVLVAGGAYLIGQTSSNSTSTTSSTQTIPTTIPTNPTSANDTNPTPQTSPKATVVATNPPTTNRDDISVCAQAAQGFADINTKSWGAVWAQMSNPPTTQFVVVSSHYVKSQNSCYVLLHNQNTVIPPQYSGKVGYINTYWLQVANEPVSGMPAEYVPAFTKVAECDTEPTVACRFYGPKVFTSSTGAFWSDQYFDGNTAGYAPPSMSYQDFQSLVQQDMNAN